MRYSMVVEWSDKDQVYLVILPEWADKVNTPTTHGATYEEAVKNGAEVLNDLVDIWKERGWELPTAHVYATV
jgi:predicted RNase H-like HicB family nuclease